VNASASPSPALYGDPAILFLDEASSALDDATERDIMEHIRMLSRDVAVLAITHRRTVIAETDKVIDLNTDLPCDPTGEEAVSG